MSKSNSQLNLPPLPVVKETQQDSPRANHTPANVSRAKGTQQPDADEMSAELFDTALTAASVTTAEAAFLLGISESLVRRMRSKDSRERVSFAQLLRLPPAFHLELHRAMNARYGYGRQALLDALDALGRIALVMER